MLAIQNGDVSCVYVCVRLGGRRIAVRFANRGVEEALKQTKSGVGGGLILAKGL